MSFHWPLSNNLLDPFVDANHSLNTSLLLHLPGIRTAIVFFIVMSVFQNFLPSTTGHHWQSYGPIKKRQQQSQPNNETRKIIAVAICTTEWYRLTLHKVTLLWQMSLKNGSGLQFCSN
jgi:hypothetical protein